MPLTRFVLKLLSIFVLSIAVSSCTHQSVSPSIYYWKTTFRLSNTEQGYLKKAGIEKMYLRLFDIDWDNTTKRPLPAGSIRFVDSIPPNLLLVPVVYITNKVFVNSKPEEIEPLAKHLFTKITSICRAHHIRYKEIQIDCDWSDKSRNNYFNLLRALTQKLNKDQFLSATIRLHQIKYSSITGVPPVKRGMLMFYNMGKISPKADYNSIYNKEDAARYTQNIKNYALPLDVALPAFSWGIQLRDGKVVGLLNNFSSSFLKNNLFEKQEGSYYKAKDACFFRSYYFKKDDLIKIEELTPELTLQAAQQISQELKADARSVSIYHCDSLIFTRYEKNDLNKIYHCFR